jgi:spore germination protein YaaH
LTEQSIHDIVNTFELILSQHLQIIDSFFTMNLRLTASRPFYHQYVYILLSFFTILCSLLILDTIRTVPMMVHRAQQMIRPPTKPKEVIAFAPYWTIPADHEVEFQTLTTLAYFDIPLLPSGDLDTQSKGYRNLFTPKTQQLLQAARNNQVHVGMTISLMDNDSITAFLEQPDWSATMQQMTALLRSTGSDTLVIDIEYTGTPSPHLKDRFTEFVAQTSQTLQVNDDRYRVITAVYASAARQPMLYDVQQLSQHSNYMFMMAYDFATTSATTAMPTAPLYGHKEGLYWYDIATAVDDFLKLMPREKLILGVPYYGYNYALADEPGVKANLRTGQAFAQTVKSVEENVNPRIISQGWDNAGKVGWKAYRDPQTAALRIIFSEDERSLREKYLFAANKQLAGVGMWALGFDNNRKELWNLLAQFKSSNS